MKKVTLPIAVAMGLLASGIAFAQDGPIEKKKDRKAEKYLSVFQTLPLLLRYPGLHPGLLPFGLSDLMFFNE